MDDITIFNLRVVNKGALKATVSIRLGSGLTIHDCKIIQQDGVLNAALPQRSERQKGGEVVYHDLVEFADPKTWPAIAPQLVAFGQGFEGYPDYRVIIDEACSPADLEAYFLDVAILPDSFEEMRDGGLSVAFSLSFGGKRLNHNQPIAIRFTRTGGFPRTQR
jgi:DNA-binding cell septation regulator SpoVG